MFINIHTICLVLLCVVFHVDSDGNNLNYLEKKVYAIESSIEADMHFLRKEVKANTEQITKLVDLLNNTIQLVNSRSENNIVDRQPINRDDKTSDTRQYSDILQEIRKVSSKTFRNKRAILEEKQVAREVYSKLATGIETIQTSLQVSVKRAELFLEKSLGNIQSDIGSKFDEIQNLIKATKLETEGKSDKTVVKMLQSLESNMEKLRSDVSLTKLVTVLDTLKINPMQNEQVVCNGTDKVSLERCDSFIWFGNEINMSQLVQKNVRLSNMANIPNGVQGRLEVFYNGEWGTVCDDLFNDTDATVACNHLGYVNGTAHGDEQGMGEAAFGKGLGQIWMDDVQCTGTESSLFQCPRYEFGNENCGHNEDVGVSCFS